MAEAGSPSSKGLLTPFVHCTRGSVAFQSLFKPITITGATLYLARLNTEYFTLTSHLFLATDKDKRYLLEYNRENPERHQEMMNQLGLHQEKNT